MREIGSDCSQNGVILPLRRRHRLSRVLKPEIDRKRGKKLHGFETLEQARAEDEQRLSSVARTFGRLIFGFGAKEVGPWLGRSRQPLEPVQVLLRHLKQETDEDDGQGSLASMVAMRAIREEVLGRVLEFLEPVDNSQLVTFTLINVQWRLTAEELRTREPVTIIGQLRTHLNRAGVSTIKDPLIAFIHGEWEPKSGCFQLHVHGITTRRKADRLRGLLYLSGRRKRGWGYERTATGAAPLRREPVRDRVRQVSYLLKSFWPERIVRDAGGQPRRDRDGHRIGDPHHLLVLLWLDRHHWTDLALLQGCRFRKTGELRRG